MLYSGMKQKRKVLSHLIDNRQKKASFFEEESDNGSLRKRFTLKKKKGSITKSLKQSSEDFINDNLSLTSIKYMLIQAGLKTTVTKFWIYSVFSGVLFYFLGITFGFSGITLICFALFGFLGFPRFVLKRKVNKRQTKFLEEFADCLEAMMRLLKSGMPISEAIIMSSREFAGPIGEEMTKVYEDQRVGDTLPEAVRKLAFRMPLPEVKMFATAVTIQVQTGSSLSDVLENLANVIRGRFRLKRKVKAVSAEARISAAIIGALPILVIAGMYAFNRDYISLLWTTSMGQTMIYGCVFWMLIGVLVMRQMINFKV
jgi:tight adherence protein B